MRNSLSCIYLLHKKLRTISSSRVVYSYLDDLYYYSLYYEPQERLVIYPWLDIKNNIGRSNFTVIRRKSKPRLVEDIYIVTFDNYLPKNLNVDWKQRSIKGLSSYHPVYIEKE